jgi:hypothetical protein
MAAFSAYHGKAGMARAVVDLEQMRKARFEDLERLVNPAGMLDPAGLLAIAERAREVAGELADLAVAGLLISLHLDKRFKSAAVAASRARAQEAGFAGRIVDHGWELTNLLLRGGLRLTIWTPYLRPSRKGQRGRPREHRGEAGSGEFPLLVALGIRDGVTPDARSEIARQVVQCSSYEEAQEQLRRDGIDVDLSVLVRVALATGEQALQRRDEAFKAALEDPLPERSALEGKRVRVSLDGGRVRTRKAKAGCRKGKKTARRPFETPWREPRLITVDVLDGEGHVDPEWKVVYETTIGDADHTFLLLTSLLRLLGAHLAEVVEFVSDGAAWIWSRVDKLMRDVGVTPDRVRLVLDYYHACEHVNAAIAACANLKGDAASKLFKVLSHRLKEPGGTAEVLPRLRALVRGRRSKAIKDQIAYIEAHIAHMDYASLRSEHLAIGSGVVESGVRRVINLRFKSAATFWREDHLEPLICLRAILKSGRWDAFMLASLSRRYHVSLSPDGAAPANDLPALRAA